MANEKEYDERSFREAVGAKYDEKAPDLTKTLNIAVVGKVSSGKSSLINALLRRGRDNPVAEVGARSGVTTRLQVFRLDDHVCIIDSPGLDDVAKENSDMTRKFLESIDVGILVVTGSVDASQKAHLDDLRARCKRMFVVLNKIDAWDHLVATELDEVIGQWKAVLGIDKLYPTCTKGFDPKSKPDVAPDVRGVDELRADVEAFVEAEGKALLLARQMGEKRSYAMRIVVTALVAVGGEAFIPGSAVYITATQAVAIGSLYYLYTGRVLSKASALALLPTFAAENVGTTLFLWVTSLLPTTGVINVMAAGVAMTVTAAMLLTVNAVLASGAELHEKQKLRSKFKELHGQLSGTISGANKRDWLTATFWQKVIHDVMYA
jgi:small GTP-binding protein